MDADEAWLFCHLLRHALCSVLVLYFTPHEQQQNRPVAKLQILSSRHSAENSMELLAPYYGRAAQCLIDYCLPVSDVASRQHLRSASRRRLLVVPRHRLSTYGRRAFAVAGTTTWNSFPR